MSAPVTVSSRPPRLDHGIGIFDGSGTETGTGTGTGHGPPARTGRLVLVLLLGLAVLSWPAAVVPARAGGDAATPPMGWNSWNQVRCYALSEQVVRDAADALVRTGLRDAGYRYVVVDDCWQDHTRGPDGSLRADPRRFPGGIAALAAYVHARGLRFGIYAVPGSGTCAMYNDGYPATGIGSIGHERQDARTFADWSVDYLKYDWCQADVRDGLEQHAAYATMRDALAAQSRPITYSISEYGVTRPWEWARPVANLWRTSNDLSPDWASIASVIEGQAEVAEHTGSPGGWNDPDMLQIGNGTLTEAESRAHLSLWAILNAPLFLGTDPDTLNRANLALLGDPEVLAVDRDWAGAQGRRFSATGSAQVWGKPLSGGGYALVLLNTGETAAPVSATVPGRWRVRDLWQHRETGLVRDTVTATVGPHDVVLLTLRPVD